MSPFGATMNFINIWFVCLALYFALLDILLNTQRYSAAAEKTVQEFCQVTPYVHDTYQGGTSTWVLVIMKTVTRRVGKRDHCSLNSHRVPVLDLTVWTLVTVGPWTSVVEMALITVRYAPLTFMDVCHPFTARWFTRFYSFKYLLICQYIWDLDKRLTAVVINVTGAESKCELWQIP